MTRIGMAAVPGPEKAPELVCPYCGKEFKSAGALKTHCKKEHPEAFDNSER